MLWRAPLFSKKKGDNNMGNVNMEASQINDRTGSNKMSVAQHLKALDAIASAIEGLPTFTSNDRAFLEELPAFPSEDGVKVLTATTNEGATNLSYETVESGENKIYSTTPVDVGKWVDDRVVKRVCLPFNTVDNATVTISLASYNIDVAWCAGCYVKETKYGTNNMALTPLYDTGNDSFHFQYVASTDSLSVVCGGEKQGSGYIILEYVEKTV